MLTLFAPLFFIAFSESEASGKCWLGWVYLHLHFFVAGGDARFRDGGELFGV
jgi:hypothetical protein